jgi:hypothetical protein
MSKTKKPTKKHMALKAKPKTAAKKKPVTSARKNKPPKTYGYLVTENTELLSQALKDFSQLLIRLNSLAEKLEKRFVVKEFSTTEEDVIKF